MATNYPGGLDSFTGPAGTDDVGTDDHADRHADTQDGLVAVQTELGTDPAGSEATVKARIAATEAVADAAPTIASGASDPSTTPTKVGDVYVNTTADTVWVAAGTATSADWKQATGAGGGDLLAANNLSDVASAATSRTNLGVAIGSDVQAHSAVLDATTASFTTSDETKLDGIEALADVTDTANVTAAGALMDSEVDADIKTLSLPASTTISTFGASLVDDADAAAARTTLGTDITSASDVDDLTNITAATQAGTTYTLALTDAFSTILFSNASAVTVTIPLNAAVAFATGTRILLQSTGAGGLTLSTTGITLNGSSPNTTIAQNEGLWLEKTATDTWSVVGGTAA